MFDNTCLDFGASILREMQHAIYLLLNYIVVLAGMAGDGHGTSNSYIDRTYFA